MCQKSKNVFCVSRKSKKAITKEHGEMGKKISDTNTVLEYILNLKFYQRLFFYVDQ